MITALYNKAEKHLVLAAAGEKKADASSTKKELVAEVAAPVAVF